MARRRRAKKNPFEFDSLMWGLMIGGGVGIVGYYMYTQTSGYQQNYLNSLGYNTNNLNTNNLTNNNTNNRNNG